MGSKWGKLKLTPGGIVRVYRQGGGFSDCQGQYLIPDDGSDLVIRDLSPGPYEAREADSDVVIAFEAHAGDEVVVLPVRRVVPKKAVAKKPARKPAKKSGTK